MNDIIKNWKDTDSVSISCSILEEGGVIVYPTDTIYGFGCDATNEHAIKKINLIKRRQTPISVMAPSGTNIQNWFNVKEKHKSRILKKVFSSDTYIVLSLIHI